jgi:hypothetical protein
MSRAGNLSMLVVVLGVFGGAIAFGFIGLFVAARASRARLEPDEDVARAPPNETAGGMASQP